MKLYYFTNAATEYGVCDEFTALAHSKEEAWQLFKDKLSDQLEEYDMRLEHWTVKELALDEPVVIPHYNYS
jgi:hypothetical protein